MNSRTLTAFVVTALLLAGCSKPSPDLPVKGTVTDAASGAPIQGAVISDGRYGPKRIVPAITDATGSYSCTTWSEEHNITATAPGYTAQTVSSNDIRDGHTLDFRLTPRQ